MTFQLNPVAVSEVENIIPYFPSYPAPAAISVDKHYVDPESTINHYQYTVNMEHTKATRKKLTVQQHLHFIFRARIPHLKLPAAQSFQRKSILINLSKVNHKIAEHRCAKFNCRCHVMLRITRDL